jgi:hypothetical protein
MHAQAALRRQLAQRLESDVDPVAAQNAFSRVICHTGGNQVGTNVPSTYPNAAARFTICSALGIPMRDIFTNGFD